jgi:NADH:ubiquinone oxidoreductase subunit B-like Fe-S oxidoreductase
MLVYLNDILICSDTIEEHARRVRMVFERIREANFQLNLGKCTFAICKMAYLGHVVSASSVSPDE